MDSPYASHLHTNYSPTDSEILNIKQLLMEPLAQLSRLDAEITLAQSILDELNRKRAALDDEIEAHRALISPLRRLPLDIIGEIFVHCLPERRNAVMSAREAPVLLGRVCSAWRSVALSTPRLWASLHIPTPVPEMLPPPPAFVREMATRCEVAKEWIVRSGETPLSISINMPNDDYNDGSARSHLNIESPFATALRQILFSTRRWKNVDFRAVGHSLTDLQEIVEDDVPMLESLTIVCVPVNNVWSSVPALALPLDLAKGRWTKSSGLFSAPALRKLSLSYLKADLLSLPVRWSQLTHLKLEVDGLTRSEENPSSLWYYNVFDVLKKCPLLVSCGFRLKNPRPDEVVPQREVSPTKYTLTLPLLGNLSLNLGDQSNQDKLKYLALPILRHLNIKVQTLLRYTTILRENQHSAVIDFLLQNGAPVKQLFIDIYAMTTDELIRCLKSVPSLTHLYLKNSSSRLIIDDEVIDRLTPSDENPDCLCPMLEEFKCEGQSVARFSEARLMYFIQKRYESANHGGVLKQVRLIFDRSKPENVNELLASLASETGMKVILPDRDTFFTASGVRICVESSDSELMRDRQTTTVDVRYARRGLLY